MRLFMRIFNLLLPLALFVLVMLKVREFFNGEGEDVRLALIIMLGALAVLAVWLGLLLKYYYLPVWGSKLGERLYMSSYSPEEDPLVALAERIRREHARELLPQMETLVRQESSRPRAWAELATLLMDEFNDPAAALKALLSGAEQVPRKEDRALFLCRAAHLCETRLQDFSRAAELYAQAASKYPTTAYGKIAAAKHA